MKINDLSWMIGGEAGSGIQSAGHFFALTCSRAGLYIFGNAEYPSLIRGGHNSNSIRVADFEVSIHREDTDLLLAMNRETLDLHLPEMAKGGGVIYDQETITDYEIPASSKGTAGKSDRKDLQIFGVPLKRLAMEAGKGLITRNVVGLGASWALLGMPLELLLEVLKEGFARKGDETVENNLAAARAGRNYILENYPTERFGFRLEAVEKAPRRLMVTGNDLVSMAAIQAGVKLVAEYPMTPSSTVLHFMAKKAREYNIVVKHTEDELAAMNMVAGAGWAGVRAMTATSGGGFSLMSEALGMAGMIEAPAVIYEVQRGGPSTGMPTRTEQSDLQFVMHASQGEFPRLVVAPGDYPELFEKTFEAFNIAEKYQMPAIIISDKHLGETIKNLTPPAVERLKIERGKLIRDPKELASLKERGYASPDGGFLRYKLEKDGVSHRVLPGLKGGRHRSSTDEHDESGDLTEDPENRIRMHEKRMNKLAQCLKELPAPRLVGPGKNGAFTAGPAYKAEEADVTFVTWGSPKDALLEVLQMLKKEGIKANLLQISYFIPFHTREVKALLKRCKFKVGVEMNLEGQMCNFITEKTGLEMDARILNWSGRQLTAQELYRNYRTMAG
jgi:2-oxoglutarate ferredoxin oxidoreductase subunit alpha